VTDLAVGVHSILEVRRRSRLPSQRAELDLDDPDGVGHGNLNGIVGHRSPEPGLGVQGATVVGLGALGIAHEGLAVVGEADPLPIVEGLSARPLTVAGAVPVAEQAGQPSEVGMDRGEQMPSNESRTGPRGSGPGFGLPSLVVADIDGIERVLVVVAHPDDCDFGNAGTTAKWTDAGVTVTYCLITDGDAGGSDRSITRQEMARLRRIEQTAAAAEVGVSDLTFLGYPDGRLTPSIELRRDISRVIRQQRPQRVITQSPVRKLHPYLREPSGPPRGR